MATEEENQAQATASGMRTMNLNTENPELDIGRNSLVTACFPQVNDKLVICLNNCCKVFSEERNKGVREMQRIIRRNCLEKPLQKLSDVKQVQGGSQSYTQSYCFCEASHL